MMTLSPSVIARRLRKLQDRTAPFPAAVVRAEAEAAFGGPLDRFFAAFGEIS